jgi:hypothetical protein
MYVDAQMRRDCSDQFVSFSASSVSNMESASEKESIKNCFAGKAVSVVRVCTTSEKLQNFENKRIQMDYNISEIHEFSQKRINWKFDTIRLPNSV